MSYCQRTPLSLDGRDGSWNSGHIWISSPCTSTIIGHVFERGSAEGSHAVDVEAHRHERLRRKRLPRDLHLHANLAKAKKRGYLHRAQHRERLNAEATTKKAENKLNEGYYCEHCKTSCHTKGGLDEQFATAKHKFRMAELNFLEEISYEYNYEPCAYKSNKLTSWNDHYMYQHHKNKVAVSGDVQVVEVKPEMRFYYKLCDYETDVSNT